MPVRKFWNRENLAWVLLGGGLALWVVTTRQSGSSSLILTAPFLQLGLSFWIGLLSTIGAFFLGGKIPRLCAAILTAFYFVATISFLYPFAVMHDSINNTITFPQGAAIANPYGQSYAVFGSLVSFLLQITGSDPWTVARFFPFGMTVGYLLTLGLIFVTWRGRLFSSSESALMFLFFFFAFGDVFYLRINASPQTLGFLFFLIALGIIPIANRSIWLRGLLLMDLAVIIILHPATPLLALPGLVVAAYVADEQRKGALRKTLAFIGTFLVGYVAWTMYRADWIFSQAVKTVLSAFSEEKRLPIVDSPVVPQIEVYVELHRILLIGLLLVLVISFISTWRSKIWYFVAVWGIALVPAFLILFSYKDFFDRVLLFALVPCAILFAEAWERFRERFTSWKIRGAAVFLLVCLALLSASVAYFSIGSVDRITQGEVDALQFLSGMPEPVRVYANGFNLPLSPNLRFIPATRGRLHWEDIDQADAVILSQQMINAVALNPSPEHILAELMAILERDFQEIYDNGEVRIFLRIQDRAS